MVGEELVSGVFSGLPYWIILTVLFSYLLWAKLLNDSKLKPKNADALLDIAAIFLIFWLTILEIFYISTAISQEFQLKFHLPTSWESAKIFIIVASIILLIALVLYKKSGDQKIKFQGFLLMITILHSSMIVYLLAIYLIVFFTDLRKIFLNEFNVLLLMGLLCSLICVLVIMQRFQLEKFWKKTKIVKRIGSSKKFIIWTSVLLVVILIVVCIMEGVLYRPLIKIGEPELLQYHIYDLNSYTGPHIYGHTRMNISILTFGILLSDINVIPIYYNEFGMRTQTNIEKENLIISLGFSNFTQPQRLLSIKEIESNTKLSNTYGFVNAFPDTQNGAVLLQFDKKSINESIKNILILGYVPILWNSSIYSFKQSQNCNATSCTVTAQVKNGLDKYAISQDSTWFLHLPDEIMNHSKCQMTNISVNFINIQPGTSSRYMLCQNDRCDVDVFKRDSLDPFSVNIFKEDRNIYMRYLQTEPGLEATIMLTITC